MSGGVSLGYVNNNVERDWRSVCCAVLCCDDQCSVVLVGLDESPMFE